MISQTLDLQDFRRLLTLYYSVLSKDEIIRMLIQQGFESYFYTSLRQKLLYLYNHHHGRNSDKQQVKKVRKKLDQFLFLETLIVLDRAPTIIRKITGTAHSQIFVNTVRGSPLRWAISIKNFLYGKSKIIV